MNKVFKSAIALSSFCMIVGCGKTDNSVNPEDFVGDWVTDGPTLIVAKSTTDNVYSFDVAWSTVVNEQTTWNYVCNFDTENNYMNCNGNKNFTTYNDNGDIISNDISLENATAKFYLTEEGIKWTDEIENAGKDKVFEKGN